MQWSVVCCCRRCYTTITTTPILPWAPARWGQSCRPCKCCKVFCALAVTVKSCILRATTKRSSIFFEKKCTPGTKCCRRTCVLLLLLLLLHAVTLLVTMIVIINMAHTGGPHEARLLRQKFAGDQYLVTSRPVANESEALRVNFSISLQQIREVVSLPFVYGDYRLSDVNERPIKHCSAISAWPLISQARAAATHAPIKCRHISLPGSVVCRTWFSILTQQYRPFLP